MNVLTAIRERVLCWGGHGARMDCSEICAKSLEMSRTAVVEMAPTFLERGKEKSNGHDRIRTVQIYSWEERRCTETDRHFFIQPTRNNHTTERNAQQLVK